MRLMSEISEGVFTTLLKTSLENLPEKGEKMKHLETNYIKQSEFNFIIILKNDDEVKKFNELTNEKLTRPCIITINNGCVCTSNLAELSFYQDLGFIPLEIKKEQEGN